MTGPAGRWAARPCWWWPRRPPPGYPLQHHAGLSLERLGPVLADDQLGALITEVSALRLFHTWAGLLPALAAHGARALALRPLLARWLAAGPAPVQIGADYHREVRSAAGRALAALPPG